MSHMNRRLILACLLACSAVGLQTDAARAEVHVDFLFGGHGHGHGHYHHHYHPHYRYWGDYYWYAPPPVRYVPVASPQVVYVPTPVTTNVPVVTPSAAAQPAATQAPTLATPNIRTNALPIQSTTREASNTARETTTVANPAGSGGQVSFILDGKQEMTLAPGETTTLTDAVGRSVEFDRGESFGTTRVTLTEGAYEFAVTANGWDLQRRSSLASTNSAQPVVRRNALPTQR